MLNHLRTTLRTYVARRLQVPEVPFGLARLEANGFHPDLVFDAGAYRGDFARMCLNVWPSCEVGCFEALADRAGDLQTLQAAYPRVRVFRCLLGATARQGVPLNVSQTGSSVLQEQVPQAFPIQLCEMRTVDEVVAQEYAGRAPTFLKLDVQGYELEILRGAEHALTSLQLILLESNLIDIHQGVPLLAEIVGWLDARDWVAYDICGLTRRPLDGALWQADLIFVPRDSALRADKRWNK